MKTVFLTSGVLAVLVAGGFWVAHDRSVQQENTELQSAPKDKAVTVSDVQNKVVETSETKKSTSEKFDKRVAEPKSMEENKEAMPTVVANANPEATEASKLAQGKKISCNYVDETAEYALFGSAAGDVSFVKRVDATGINKNGYLAWYSRHTADTGYVNYSLDIHNEDNQSLDAYRWNSAGENKGIISQDKEYYDPGNGVLGAGDIVTDLIKFEDCDTEFDISIFSPPTDITFTAR